jgi:hypothetical protein
MRGKMFTKESVQRAFEIILLEYNFQFPISWVWIGINGTFLTGRFELSKSGEKLKTTVLSGKVRKIRFPVNIMLVDGGGKAAHILLNSAEFGEVTRCSVDEPLSIAPLN